MWFIQYLLSSADLEQYECEVNQANRKEILDQAARNLPVQCRTIAGGLCPHVCLHVVYVCASDVVEWF